MSGQPTIRSVAMVVGATLGVTWEEMAGPGRGREVTFARHVAEWVASRLLGAQLTMIGRIFGGRYLKAVAYGVERIDGMADDERVKAALAAVRQVFGDLEPPEIDAGPIRAMVAATDTRRIALRLLDAGEGDAIRADDAKRLALAYLRAAADGGGRPILPTLLAGVDATIFDGACRELLAAEAWCRRSRGKRNEAAALDELRRAAGELRRAFTAVSQPPETAPTGADHAAAAAH